jgi:YbbR domain-containing protein
VTWLRSAGLRLLLAIGLGFALWVFVSYTENPDRLIQFKGLPVVPEDLAPDLVIVDQSGLPNSSLPPVTVTLRAAGERSAAPNSNDIQAYVNLGGRGPGEWNIPVGARVTIPGRKPDVAEIKPDFLSIRIEHVITRTVPLTVELTGNVPFSYEAQPARVLLQGRPITTTLVHGPRSHVERVKLVRAAANIDRLTGNYSSQLPLEAIGVDGEIVRGVTIEPELVNVEVPIVSSVGIKRVPVVPVVEGQPASGYVVSGLSVQPEFVRLAGGSGALEEVESISTETLNIEGASQTLSHTVRLREPAFTPLLSGEPTTATITVRIAPIERPFQVKLPAAVQVADVGPGLSMSVSPTIVQVTLSGAAAQLAAIDPAALVGLVSMRGRDAGTYTVEPEFRLPPGITQVGEPPKVTVTLRLLPSPTPRPTPTPEVTPQPSTAPTLAPTTEPAALPTSTAEPAPAETPAETPGPSATAGS